MNSVDWSTHVEYGAWFLAASVLIGLTILGIAYAVRNKTCRPAPADDQPRRRHCECGASRNQWHLPGCPAIAPRNQP